MSESTKTSNFTFGVEIEHLFCIKQDAVRADPKYEWLLPQNCPIKEGVPLPEKYEPGNEEHNNILKRTGVRQAAKILRNNGATLEVRLSPDPGEEADEFWYWKLTTDESVRVPKNNMDLRRWSRNKVADMQGLGFSKLELVSPVLEVPETGVSGYQANGLKDLEDFLKFVPESHPPEVPYLFMTAAEVGSVHVHIGLQPTLTGQVDISLEFLQHLAFICLAFEDTITLLHHPERHGYRGTKVFGHAKSNRIVGKRSENRAHYCKSVLRFSCEDTFIAIFKASDKFVLRDVLHPKPGSNPEDDDDDDDDNAGTEFVDYPREWFVNFLNAFDAAGPDGKKTIEFRQHHGTLEADDIREWVIFVTALARAAERKTNQATDPDAPMPQSIEQKLLDKVQDDQKRRGISAAAGKYTELFHSGKKRTLRELFDLLELPKTNREYWWKRAQKFREEWADKYADKSTCVCEPACDLTPVRDSEGWDDGELAEPPYDEPDEDDLGEKNDDDDEDDEDDDENGGNDYNPRPRKRQKNRMSRLDMPSHLSMPAGPSRQTRTSRCVAGGLPSSARSAIFTISNMASTISRCGQRHL